MAKKINHNVHKEGAMNTKKYGELCASIVYFVVNFVVKKNNHNVHKEGTMNTKKMVNPLWETRQIIADTTIIK